MANAGEQTTQRSYLKCSVLCAEPKNLCFNKIKTVLRTLSQSYGKDSRFYVRSIRRDKLLLRGADLCEEMLGNAYKIQILFAFT